MTDAQNTNGSTRKRRVLVVDDERLIRWAFGEALSDAGYDVVLAATACEAADRFDGSLDCVLLDIRLPDASGLTLLAQFHSQMPECVFIVVSADATVETERNAVALGAARLVHKPIALDALIEIVAQALAGRANATAP